MKYILVIIISLFISTAQAQGPPCGDYEAIHKQLKQKYLEEPIGMALSEQGVVFQLYTSPEGRTWTLLIVRPNGLACLIATGEDWEWYERKKPRI